MSYLLPWLFVLIPHYVFAICPVLNNTESFHCKELAEDKLFFYWQVVDDTVEMALHGKKHSGYMAVGLSENGGMRGSDVIAAFPGQNQSCNVKDYWSDSYSKPILDQFQHVECQKSIVSNGDFTVFFSRAAETGDPFDSPIKLAPGSQQIVIWSLGNSSDFEKHLQRGSQSISFVPASEPPASINVASDPDLCAVRVSVDEHTLPTKAFSENGNEVRDPQNPYLYVPFQLADFESQCPDGFIDSSQSYHIVFANAHLNGSKNGSYVHHILVYGCNQKPKADGPKFRGEMFEGCFAIKAQWAPGMEPFTAPTDAGLKIGGSSDQHFTLEIHYYNPRLDNVVDASGYEFIISRKLRKHDIGMLGIVRQVEFAAVEPLQRNVVLGPDICDLGCMDEQSWRQNVTILSVFYHMHQAGLSGSLELMRDGKNLGPLVHQGRFDFNNQRWLTPDITTLMPNDKLLSYCSFNTLDRPATTDFGYRSNDQEMCNHFVLYYPEQPLKFCASDMEADRDGTVRLSVGRPRYHAPVMPVWNQKKEFYDMLCTSDGDDMYSLTLPFIQDICDGCAQNFSAITMTTYCAGLVADRSCPRCACFDDDSPLDGADCPALNTCSIDDYKQLIDHLKSIKCDGYLAGTHRDTWMGCQVTKDVNFVPQTAWLPIDLPQPAQKTLVESIFEEKDECLTHSDCDNDQYCVNGRLAFSPAARFDSNTYSLAANPTRNTCRDLHLCCQNIDAVGPDGEVDKLYPCPDFARCTSWSSKAYSCYLNSSSYVYCPSLDENGRDYCINATAQTCSEDCDPSSKLSGYDTGIKVCLRDSDKDSDGFYGRDVPNAPPGKPRTDMQISFAGALSVWLIKMGAAVFAMSCF